MIYQILENFVQDQHFNTNSSLLLVQNILNGTLDIFNPNTTLTSSQIASVSEILSDMMSFSSTYDCSGKTNFTQDLLTKTQQYLEKIAQSSLNNQITNQNATVIDTQNIDMYLQKLSICTLNNKVISAGSASPQITITVNSDIAENCSYVVNLEYYAFNDNLLNCSSEVSSNNSKSNLGIQVTDPATGQKSPVNMSVSINYGKDISKCPSSCTILSGTICHCDDLSPFDVGKQLLKVFANSNLFYIKKIASLLTFQFWTTASFWMIFLLTSWFLFTLAVIRYKLRKYDVMVRVKQFTQLSKMNIIWMTLQVGHHLVAIYLVPNQEKLSKSARALFFYTRTLLLLSFSSIFAGPARDEDNYKYEGFEWRFDFNVYLFILPFLTVHPLLFIIKQLMIEPKNANHKKSFATKLLHFVRTRVTIWFVMLIIVGNFIIIFIINSNQTPVQRIAWTIDFIQSLMQDLALTPLLYMLSQYYIFKAHSSPKFAKKFPRIHVKLIPRILEESLQEIFTKISPNRPKLRANKIAPAPTQSNKALMKSNSDVDSLSAISDSPNNDSLNMEKLLKNVSSPNNKFDPFKSSNYLSAAVIKEEALEESPCLPKPSTLLYLESPNNEEFQKQNINISKLFESVDLDFAYKNPRALKFQNSLLQLQDLNPPKENKTHGIKKLYIPDLSPKTDVVAQSKDFSDSNFLLTQQQTPKDKDEELLLNFKKITSTDNNKDTSPASLLMKRESSAIQYQNSTERSDKTLLGGFSKTDEELKLLTTLRSAQSPDAVKSLVANEGVLLDRPMAQKLRRLHSETESSKAKVSKPSKLNRATTGFKSVSFNKLVKSKTISMESEAEKGVNKGHKESQNETINPFNDKITIQNLEDE